MGTDAGTRYRRMPLLRSPWEAGRTVIMPNAYAHSDDGSLFPVFVTDKRKSITGEDRDTVEIESRYSKGWRSAHRNAAREAFGTPVQRHNSYAIHVGLDGERYVSTIWHETPASIRRRLTQR